MGINFLFQREGFGLSVVDSIGLLQIQFGLKNKHRKSGLVLSLAGLSEELPAREHPSVVLSPSHYTPRTWVLSRLGFLIVSPRNPYSPPLKLPHLAHENKVYRSL